MITGSSDTRLALKALRELHDAVRPIFDRADRHYPEALSLEEFDRFGLAVCDAAALLGFAQVDWIAHDPEATT